MSFYGYKSNSKVGKVKPSVRGIIGSEPLSKYKKVTVDSIKLGSLSNSFKGQSSNILKSFNYLFDEQIKTPLYVNEGVKQNTNWINAFTNIWGSGLKFPYDAIIGFNTKKEVSKVGLWLGWGENEGKIQIYNNETNELLLSKTVEGKNKWIVLDLKKSVKTKSLKLIKYDSKPIYEMSFYGSN